MGPGGRNLVKPCILNFGDFYIFNISDIYLCVVFQLSKFEFSTFLFLIIQTNVCFCFFVCFFFTKSHFAPNNLVKAPISIFLETGIHFPTYVLMHLLSASAAAQLVFIVCISGQP